SFFSAAFMRSYLEHEMHPGQVLAETYRTLVPGGVVLIKVPNFASLNRIIMGKRWCGFRYPDHLNYFTPGTMSEMAKRCGFKVHFPLFGRIPTNDNMHVVLKKPV
ncbi:MAG: methyltransferase domain-containing protein, partial [Rhodospirillales bacterium]